MYICVSVISAYCYAYFYIGACIYLVTYTHKNTCIHLIYIHANMYYYSYTTDIILL